MTFVETVNERTNSYLWKYFRLNDGSEVHSLYKADFFLSIKPCLTTIFFVILNLEKYFLPLTVSSRYLKSIEIFN